MSSKEKRPALISDFDNTLFFRNTEERFKAQDIFEILFFQKRGGIFGICTGRSPDSVLDTISSFMHPDFIISVSGALIVDGEGNVLDSADRRRGGKCPGQAVHGPRDHGSHIQQV